HFSVHQHPQVLVRLDRIDHTVELLFCAGDLVGEGTQHLRDLFDRVHRIRILGMNVLEVCECGVGGVTMRITRPNSARAGPRAPAVPSSRNCPSRSAAARRPPTCAWPDHRADPTTFRSGMPPCWWFRTPCCWLRSPRP